MLSLYHFFGAFTDCLTSKKNQCIVFTMRIEIDFGSPEGQAYVNRISPTDEEVEKFKLTEKQINELFPENTQYHYNLKRESDILTAQVTVAAIMKLTHDGISPSITDVWEATDMYFVRKTGKYDKSNDRTVMFQMIRNGFVRWNGDRTLELLVSKKPRQ